jgi:hypothetical protein
MKGHLTPPDLRDQMQTLMRRVSELERRASRSGQMMLGPGEWAADGSLPWPEEWGNHAAASHLRFTRDPFSPRGAGFYSLRVDVIDGDDGDIYVSRDNYNTQDPITNPTSGERAEVCMANPYDRARSRLHYEGDERWFAWSYYLPSTTPIGGGFVICNQWKQIGGVGGVPAVSMQVARSAPLVGATRYRLMCSDNTDPDTGATVERAAVNIPTDQWVRSLLRIKFHRNPAIGRLEWWVDIADGQGLQQIMAETPFTTMTDPDVVSGGNLDLPDWDTVPISHVRLGTYRDPANAGDATAWYDGFTCATTRETAEANAFRPS